VSVNATLEDIPRIVAIADLDLTNLDWARQEGMVRT